MKMKFKKTVSIIISLTLITFLLTSCSLLKSKDNGGDTSNAKNSADASAIDTSLTIPEPSEDDLQNDFDISKAATITFNKSEISVIGSGAAIIGKTVNITKAGTYVLSGTGNDSQVIIDAGDDDIIKLVLNSADITCQTSSAIFVKNAGKVILNSAADTTNSLADGSSYSGQSADDEPDSTVFSKDDLTINGRGILNITANFNDAVKSEDTLIITGSTINITSTDDGIIGKDYVVITDGTFNIDAKGDGIKSTYDADTNKGAIAVYGGAFNITSGADGIQAQTKVAINDGAFSIKTGGGYTNAAAHTGSSPGGFNDRFSSSGNSEDSGSYKGIKCGYIVEITGGNFAIDCADDAIHSNNTVMISGGVFNIATGDDGVHADTTLNYSDGEMTISSCYEGLEAATINFSGGNVRLTASDDGINAAGGNDSSNESGPMGGDKFSSSSNYAINITGGYLYIDASGDGIDSNGSVYMSEGTVIINGPTNNSNGAFDYDNEFVMTGGTLIAAGSSGMAQTISSSSSVYSVSVGFSQSISNMAVRVIDSSGNDIISFLPSKAISNIVIASPLIKQNGSYTVKTSSYISGNNSDGLITNGKFNSETEIGTFTASSVLSSIGASSGAMGGMGGRGGGNSPQGDPPGR